MQCDSTMLLSYLVEIETLFSVVINLLFCFINLNKIVDRGLTLVLLALATSFRRLVDSKTTSYNASEVMLNYSPKARRTLINCIRL
jgi:hypothetical protein